MKHFFFVWVLLLGVQSGFAQKNGCNSKKPGWGKDLGTVSFVSDSIWTIGSQTWSDAVTATGCQKTEFDGGAEQKYKADCRSTSSGYGDLFSWCAVVRFGDQLCPDDWRVPTQEDFIALDSLLGGNGGMQENEKLFTKYTGSWGGVFGGLATNAGLERQAIDAYYWSLSDNGTDFGSILNFMKNNTYVMTNPQSSGVKRAGFSLRCVR